MVCEARSGSNSGRSSSRGRGLFVASASGSSSVPPPLAAGLGEFTPLPARVEAVGPSSVPPPLVAGPSASAPPAFLAGASTVPEAEDAVSLKEGGCSFYDSTLWDVWINGAIIDSRVIRTRRGLD
ncbi:hypothetical protein Taro_023517 [Colocasia esculenta]|uniref:Uncharacterized protein n=1 Tax=Colocasia esculenta TaxID=4460 RepID=A0A843V4W3_COLES|nr:hypothetical protein [Colocasia esculenta]